MVNAAKRHVRLPAKAAFEEGFVGHKYDEMFRGFSHSKGNYHLFVYWDRTFYQMAAKSAYGTKFVCFGCRRQTRSHVCCGVATTEKNPQHKVPRQNDDKGWKAFKTKVANDKDDPSWSDYGPCRMTDYEARYPTPSRRYREELTFHE